MSGGAQAVTNGAQLVVEVVRIAHALGLETREQFRMGARLWGATRFVDILVTDPATHRRIGIECKFQGVGGSAEEKLPATIQDIALWPIPGIIVIAGDGFSASMSHWILGAGRGVSVVDLDVWLRLFFCLELP